jgi:hypothetical protein
MRPDHRPRKDAFRPENADLIYDHHLPPWRIRAADLKNGGPRYKRGNPGEEPTDFRRAQVRAARDGSSSDIPCESQSKTK